MSEEINKVERELSKDMALADKLTEDLVSLISSLLSSLTEQI